jgi:hypothetical protein
LRIGRLSKIVEQLNGERQAAIFASVLANGLLGKQTLDIRAGLECDIKPR